MVEAVVNNGDTEGAYELVQQMQGDRHSKIVVNDVIYCSLLKGFAREKKLDRAWTVYQEMKAQKVEMSTVACNTLIDACARIGRMERVPDILEDMRAHGIKPNLITYSTTMKGHCQAGDIQRGLSLMEEMQRDTDLKPDEIMYNSLLDGCAKQNLVQDALWLLEDMKDSGVSPSNYTLSITVKLMGRARKLNQAFSIVEDTCAAHGFQPNVHVYTSLVQACIQNRKADKAIDVHEKMIEESGCQPDEKFYSALVRGCIQAGALEKAVSVVRCAHHLPGSGLKTSRGYPVGLEARVLDELIAKLRAGGARDRETAAALLAELKTDSRGHGSFRQ
jgi:pentatricopeptide repeat protein